MAVASIMAISEMKETNCQIPKMSQIWGYSTDDKSLLSSSLDASEGNAPEGYS
jgi:hypothetical protein